MVSFYRLSLCCRFISRQTGKGFIVTRFLLISFLLMLTACVPLAQYQQADQYKYEKPRIAVLAFDNKASLSQQWKLSEGMRDVLVDSLVKTDRYTVLTRRDLGAVMAELDAQQAPYFREQGKLEQGKLKNLQYLIKGSITDFAHVKGSALRVLGSKLGIGGSGQVAIVSVTLYVISVETGEIIASKTMEGTASAGSLDFNATYNNVAFGGKTFFRTPLGKATQEVMDKCLVQISETIANDKWYPAVVKVDGNRITISGGEDRRITVDSQWQAYAEGEELVDPVTGDILGREPGKSTGLIRVNEVFDKYSVGEILEGGFGVGQALRPVLVEKQ